MIHDIDVRSVEADRYHTGLVYPSMQSGTAHPGGGSGSAVLINEQINYFSAATAGDSVILSPTSVLPVFCGNIFWIVNTGANAMAVYPPSGGAINQLGVNAAFPMAGHTCRAFVMDNNNNAWTL